MELDVNLFYGSNGISRSEAQHLSSVAAKKAFLLTRELELLNYETISFKKDNETYYLKRGTEMQISDIQTKFELIGKLYGFVAWMREALKIGETYSSELKLVDPKILLSEEEYKQYKDSKAFLTTSIAPSYKLFTEKNVLQDYSVGNIAEYFEEESIAAHIGKFVHGNGNFIKVLENMQNFEENTFIEKGGQLFIASHELTVKSDEFFSLIETLQTQHRTHEKNVNAFKAKLKDKVTELNLQEELRFAKEDAEYQVLRNEHLKTVKDFENKAKVKSSELISEFAKLKIIIPNRYNDLVIELRK